MKKSNYIKEVEKRYGFKVKGLMTCEDQWENDYSSPDCLIFKWGVIPPNDCLDRMVVGGYNNDLLSKIKIYFSIIRTPLWCFSRDFIHSLRRKSTLTCCDL